MWPHLTPTPFALLAFVFHVVLFFCTENRQDKACRQLPHPTLLLGITTNFQSRHPVGLAATPAAPRELGPTGDGDPHHHPIPLAFRAPSAWPGRLWLSCRTEINIKS